MTADVPLIDLDLAPPGPVAAPRSWRSRLMPPRPVRLGLMLLLAVTLPAAAVAPRPVLRHVLSAGGQPAAAFELSTDALFTASFGNNPNSESAVRRWNLGSGTVAWAVALPQNVQNLVYDASSGVLMARSAADPKVAFLDAVTGETLWGDHEVNTSVYTVSAGRALFATDLEVDRRRLRLLDARSGRPLWTREVDSSGYFGTDEDGPAHPPSRVLYADRAGHATVLNFADGTVLAEGELGVDLSLQFADSSQSNFVGTGEVGDTFFVSRRLAGTTTLTAWSLRTLTVQWQTSGGPAGSVGGCGRVLCLFEENGVNALEPAGGRPLWHRDGYGLTFPYGRDALLAYGPGDIPQADLLDPLTGAVRARLGGSISLDGVLLRGDTVRPGTTWVEVPDPGGALHVVGEMDTTAPYGCERTGRYIACPTTAGPTQVWALPLGTG